MKRFFPAVLFRSPEKLLTAILAGYVVFLCLITLQAIGFSVVHIPLHRTTALVILGVSLLGGLACMRRCLQSNSTPPLQPASTPRRLRNILCLGAGLCFAAYIFLWMVSYLTLDSSWDGNFYHIPAMSLWAQEGRIHWIAPEFEANSLKYINGYAKGAEVVGYVMALGCGDFFANTINCMFLPLGILGIALLAVRLGASPMAAVFVGMLSILTPVHIWQASTTYIDSAFASCVIAFFAFFYRYVELLAVPEKSSELWPDHALGGQLYCHPCPNGLSKGDSTTVTPTIAQGTESWTIGLLTGATLGLTLGVKGNGVWMAGMVFAGLTVAGSFFIYRLWFSPAASAARENRRQFITRWFVQAGIALTICLLIGGFWYLRNYLRTGNPLYPLNVKIAGKELFPGVDYVLFLEQNTPQEWLGKSMAAKIALAWSQSCDWNNGLTSDARKGGLGFFWMLGCVPAILFVSLNRLSGRACSDTAGCRSAEIHRERISWGYWVLLGTVIVFFLFTPSNWWARYTVWIYGIGLPCFAVALTWLMRPAAAEAGERKHFSAHFALAHRDSCTNLRFRMNCPLPWRKLGILWVSACLLFLFAEGFYSLREMWRRQREVSKSWNAAGSGPCAHFYPELMGTEIPRILNERRRVALGVLDFTRPHPGNPGYMMLGVFSQPLQARHWGLIDRQFNDISLKKLQAGEFEYLIWDRSIPLPEGYACLVTLEKSYPGFIDLYRIAAPISGKSGRNYFSR